MAWLAANFLSDIPAESVRRWRYYRYACAMIHATAEQRFSIYYAALFGSIGAVAPFAAVWMDHVGISASMIGLIVAAPSVAMLLTTFAIGRWADGLTDRRQAIVVGNWVILLAQLVLFMYTDARWVLYVWLVSGVAMHAMIPITDAAALSVTRRNGSDYARVRMFGSIGFVITLTLAGSVYDSFSIGIFVFILLAVNALRLLSAWYLPVISRASVDKLATPKVTNTKDTQNSGFNPLHQPGILLTLLGGALINASHALVNTYGILLWTQQGLSELVASLAVGIGVVVEVGLMWWFRSLTGKLSARACLLLAAACGLVRWVLLASEPSIVMLFAAQMLHGVTFGIAFLSCASFIARRVPEGSAARGQSLLAIMTTACMAIATYFSGQLFDEWAAKLYWIMGGLCVLAMFAIAGSYRFQFTDDQAA